VGKNKKRTRGEEQGNRKSGEHGAKTPLSRLGAKTLGGGNCEQGGSRAEYTSRKERKSKAETGQKWGSPMKVRKNKEIIKAQPNKDKILK